MEIEGGGRLDSSKETAQNTPEPILNSSKEAAQEPTPKSILPSTEQAAGTEKPAKNNFLRTPSAKKTIALILTLFITIPLLAAFAGNGGTYSIETTTTALTAGESSGDYPLRITTTPYQAGADSGSGGSYIAEVGWFEGNNKPTQTQPIINSTYGQNLTTEHIRVYNQTFNDVDDDRLTAIINWYRNGTSIAVLNMGFEKNDPFTAQDYSGNNNHGVVYGATWNRSGIVGGGYNFNGAGSYINITDSSFLDVENTITLSAWIKPGRINTSYYIISKNNTAYELQLTADNRFRFLINDNDINSTTTAQTGKWYYVVATYDKDVINSNNKRIYVNGVLEAGEPQAGAIETNNRNLLIGFREGSNSGYFNGTIDEVRVYNIILTGEQIISDYRAGISNYDTITSSMTNGEDRWNAKVWANDNQDDSDVNATVNITILKVEEALPPIEGGARGTIGIGPSGSYGGVMAQRMECIIDEDCAENEQCINNICVQLFDIRIMRADSPIEPTEILDFTFLMKSMADSDGDATLEYWVQKPGSSEKLARAQDVIYMKSMQTKITDASLYLYKEMLGEYELVVELTFRGYTARAITPIEIVAKAQTILTAELAEFEPPKFKLRVSTNKDREIEVNLEETITKDGRIVWQNKKAVGVKKTRELEEQMGRLEAGEYELKIVAEAEGKKSEITRVFKLEKAISPAVEQPKAVGWLKNLALILLYGLGILSILVIGFYVGKAVIREERLRSGRQKAVKMISSMQKKLDAWRRKGFDTGRIEGAIRRAEAGTAGVGEAISRTGGRTAEQLKKAGRFSIKTLTQAGGLGRDAAGHAGAVGIGVLRSSAEALGRIEKGLKNKIQYWRQKGIDTSIIERKLEKFRKATMPKAPTPKIERMPAPPKPGEIPTAPKAALEKIQIKPITETRPERTQIKLLIKPAIKPAAGIEQRIIQKPTEQKPARIVEKPARIEIKPVIKPSIKPAIKAEVKPIAKEIAELKAKLEGWKKFGYDTRILERQLGGGLGATEQKPESRVIKTRESGTTALIERLENNIQRWKKSGYDTTLLEKNLRKLRTAELEKKPEQTAAKAVSIMAEKLRQKIAAWKSRGYDTTILEAKLDEIAGKEYKSEKPEYNQEKKRERRIIERLAEWKAEGYDTGAVEKQLTANEESSLQVKTLEDKIKLWKAKGYDTRILEEQLRKLKEGIEWQA